MADFHYQPIFEFGPDETPYRKLTSDGVSTIRVDGAEMLKVEPEALRAVARVAFDDVAHLLRPGHLAQLRKVIDDPESSQNDRFVALELLRNACIAADRVLPGCQDTGTAIVMGHKGERVLTFGDDQVALSQGVFDAYEQRNLRYSQMAPLDMYTEKNTGSNLPAQIEIYAEPGEEYELLFIAKGGGSANKSFLYQETKALLNPASLLGFVEEKLKTIGTAACPPYHLALVVGGTSAEFTLKTLKLATTKYLDRLPSSGNEHGRAFRDHDLEGEIFELARQIGVGAQFGGKYFAHDVRVVRLPRHGASCPVGLGVSCSADRQALAKITRDGVFLEQLEENPARFLPDVTEGELPGDVVRIDLNRPMRDILAELTKYPVATRLSLSGPMIVARDIAHAKLKERLDAGEELPAYARDHMVYYAGPAKRPEGRASGSFGPTTAGRMDSYVDLFQSHGGSMVMLAKGNRSGQVTEACKRHGGFYLGSIGGPAARLADHSIRKVDVLEYPELGMEAIWKIEVEDFPAFIVVDDKGNDFFARLLAAKPATLLRR
ncbi:MAG: fumarate hydratase [Acidobacteria bacterium]|nr:fumarate hydratase [Acidobacteriota bacterium]MYH29266.1 fumarate hydratase [Acidobacteriota bacterium]